MNHRDAKTQFVASVVHTSERSIINIRLGMGRRRLTAETCKFHNHKPDQARPSFLAGTVGFPMNASGFSGVIVPESVTLASDWVYARRNPGIPTCSQRRMSCAEQRRNI